MNMKKLLCGGILLLSSSLAGAADYIWCQSEPHDSNKRYYSKVFGGDYDDKLSYQVAFENFLRARYVDGEALLTSFCFSAATASEARSKRDEDAAYARSGIFNYDIVFLDWKY